MNIDVNSTQGRVLLALRAGEMEPMQLDERFGGNYTHGIAVLIRHGLVDKLGDVFRITQAGIAACPSRRSASFLAQQVPEATPPKPVTPETISLNSVGTIWKRMEEKMQQEHHTSTQFRLTHPPKAQPPEDGKVRSKHILDLVIGHPGIKRDEVQQCLLLPDGSNKKKLTTLISYLISANRLAQDDNMRLRPGPEINVSLERRQPKAPKQKKEKLPAAKLVPFSESGQDVPVFAAAPSNVREFKRADAPDTVKPVSDTDKPASERIYFCNDVYIDATGQLVIQQPGRVRMVFPPPDTIRIQKLLLAIDLESLCV